MDTQFINEKMKLYSKDITTVGFSRYVIDCLYWRGYKTIGKIAEMTVQDLLEIGGIGDKYCSEIVDKMAEIGIKLIDLRDENPPRSYDSPRKYPYPQNLIAAVKNINPCDMEAEHYSPDRMKGIAVALATLTEQEETMIILRYKHSAKFEQIGGFYGLTRERARQIIKTALRKISHPSRRILLEKGLEEYIENIVNSRVEARVKFMLHDEYMRGYSDAMEDAETGKDSHMKKVVAGLLELPIDEFDLSVRAFNCLKRSGVNKVGDLLTYDTEDSIMRIRNLGRRSAGEIALKLNQQGICNSAWAKFLIEDYEGVK